MTGFDRIPPRPPAAPAARPGESAAPGDAPRAPQGDELFTLARNVWGDPALSAHARTAYARVCACVGYDVYVQGVAAATHPGDLGALPGALAELERAGLVELDEHEGAPVLRVVLTGRAAERYLGGGQRAAVPG